VVDIPFEFLNHAKSTSTLSKLNYNPPLFSSIPTVPTDRSRCNVNIRKLLSAHKSHVREISLFTGAKRTDDPLFAKCHHVRKLLNQHAPNFSISDD